jgi:hypothetical protein
MSEAQRNIDEPFTSATPLDPIIRDIKEMKEQECKGFENWACRIAHLKAIGA